MVAVSSGGAGNLILSSFGKSTYVLNLTDYAREGFVRQALQPVVRAVCERRVREDQSAASTASSPTTCPGSRAKDGDWNMDGKVDSQDDKTVQDLVPAGLRDLLQDR